MRFLSLAALMSLFVPAVGMAQEASDNAVHGAVYVAPIIAPDYVGSDEYRVTPFGGFDIRYGKMFVRSEGSGLVANVSPFDHVLLGPAANFRIGRRPKDIKSSIVGKLGRVDNAWEVGGIAGLTFSDVGREGDTVEITGKLLFDVSDVHKGYTIEPSISYRMPVSRKFSLGLTLSATIGDDKYLKRYFGVEAAGSAASGLPTYAPKGGLIDAGVVLNGSYSIGGRWSLFGAAGYSKLFEQAKNSPIVSVEGDSNQFVGSLGIGYAF